MAQSLPSVSLSPLGRPGSNTLTFEINSMRFNVSHGSLGSSLLLPVEISHTKEATPLLVQGSICWTGERQGIAVPAQGLVSNSVPQYLEIPLDHSDIARIEARRAGQQALFDCWLNALVLIGESKSPTLCVADNPARISIGRDEWIEILLKISGDGPRIVELPGVPKIGDGYLGDAMAAITAAAQRIARGDSGAAIAEARTALERTVEALGMSTGKSRGAKEPFRPYAEALALQLSGQHISRSRDPYSVLAEAVRLSVSLFELCSDPVHSGLGTSERASAELVISLVTAIYTYLARTI